MKQPLWRGALAIGLALFVTAISASGAPLSKADRTAALSAIEGVIRKTYVFPDRTQAILAALNKSARDGRYDTADPDIFAERITDDLKAVSHDGHLYLNNDRRHFLAASAPAKSASGLDAYSRKLATRDNSGLVAMSILPGNVRYLRISGFEWVPRATETAYDAVLRFLKDGDAIILDLRDNGGGEGDAANYLLGAILKPNTLLYTRREGRKITQSRTRGNPEGLSLTGKPLYVLVDSHTGSAAEAFTYALQQEKAATVVGGVTFGAANNNKIFPVAPTFILSVSYARPVSAVTGTNWEVVGVKPNIEVPPILALAAAQIAALDHLASLPGTEPQQRISYDWAKIALNAQLHAVVLPPGRLRAFAGTYKAVTVSFSGDRLSLSRTDRQKWPKSIVLSPLTNDGLFEARAFAFDDLRVRFTGTALEFLYGSNDATETVPRSR